MLVGLGRQWRFRQVFIISNFYRFNSDFESEFFESLSLRHLNPKRPVRLGFLFSKIDLRSIVTAGNPLGTFGIDVLQCSRCKTRTSLVGIVRDPQTIQVTLKVM